MKESRLVLVLLLLCGLLLFFHLGVRPLWDIDEGTHAVTSKEMVTSGNWLVPTFNGKNFYDKPALYNWFVAISFLLFGFTEFAARLPSALLGLGTILVTYMLGRRMFDPVVGFLGATILATSLMFAVLSRVVVHDISLAFFVTLALALFHVGYSSERHRKRNFLLFHAALGFAVLAKGPLGLLLPGMPIALFLLLERRPGFLAQMQLGLGSLIFLAIAAPWYVAISLTASDYAEHFFLQKNLQGFFSTKGVHRHPFHYYLPILAGGMVPWTIFLPLSFVNAVRSWRGHVGGALVLLLIWFGTMFAFFSAAGAKLPTYLLPLFPALALILAWSWRELMIERWPGLRRAFLGSHLLMVLGLIGTTVVFFSWPPLRLKAKFGIDMALLQEGVLILLGVSLAGSVAVWKGRYRLFFSSLTGMGILAVLWFVLFLAPPISTYRSSKDLALRMDHILMPGEPFVMFHREKETCLFYTGRSSVLLRSRKAVADYFASSKRVFCLVDRKDMRRLEPFWPAMHVVGQVGGEFVLSNRVNVAADSELLLPQPRRGMQLRGTSK